MMPTATSLNTSLHHNEERSQPLQQKPSRTPRMNKGLNETLNTNYIDVDQGDTSFLANQTRIITGCVGKMITPRQILIVLRILKALTFAFLVLTLMADLMYIFFVWFFASKAVSTKIGGSRDVIIRVYGLGLAGMAIAIEMDMANVVKLFPGFKGFIPRGFLLFFIATVTNSHPLHESHNGRNRKNNNPYSYYGHDDDYGYDSQVSEEIPDSTVVFQMVTSVVLAGCAIAYIILGILCFDRFTSKAFLSNQDPVAATAIPPSSGIQVSPSANEGVTGQSQAHYELV